MVLSKRLRNRAAPCRPTILVDVWQTFPSSSVQIEFHRRQSRRTQTINLLHTQEVVFRSSLWSWSGSQEHVSEFRPERLEESGDPDGKAARNGKHGQKHRGDCSQPVKLIHTLDRHHLKDENIECCGETKKPKT